MQEYTFEIQEVYRLAECLARLGGYNNYRLSRLADQAKLPTSSVHHHIGNKAQLSVAIIRSFGAHVQERVGAADDPASTPDEKMATLIDVYRQSITDDGQLCLYLVFGAELHILPDIVKDEVTTFYAELFKWLETLLRRFPEFGPGSNRDAHRDAVSIVAALNGAQICTRVASDKSLFDVVVNQNYDSGLIPGKKTRAVR